MGEKSTGSLFFYRVPLVPFNHHFISSRRSYVYPDPFSSQGRNRYSYVYNNPLRYVDPSGYAGLEPPPCACGSSTTYANQDDWRRYEGAEEIYAMWLERQRERESSSEWQDSPGGGTTPDPDPTPLPGDDDPTSPPVQEVPVVDPLPDPPSDPSPPVSDPTPDPVEPPCVSCIPGTPGLSGKAILLGTLAASAGLLADDVTGVGIANDVAIPPILVGGFIIGIGVGAYNIVDGFLDNSPMQAERPKGTWPADVGAREWDRRNGAGRTGQDKFHDVKQHSPWRGGTQDWSVDPDTGDIYSPDGGIEGNLND